MSHKPAPTEEPSHLPVLTFAVALLGLFILTMTGVIPNSQGGDDYEATASFLDTSPVGDDDSSR